MASRRAVARRGYTILEVLVAITILAFVLPGIIIMVTGSRKVQNRSVMFEGGAEAAARLLNDMAIQPPANLGTSGTTTYTENGRTYTLNWTRTPYSSGGTDLGGRQLKIDVSWTAAGKTYGTSITGVLP